MSSRLDSRSWGERFSDMKKLIIEAFGTPRWISDLSAMADEVRNRTILVKIHSQMHPVNDLLMYHVFAEIGVVEDVRYMPTETGFHSVVRFRNKDGRDWAYHYYNGKILHQVCCELEVHRVSDIIRWNAQRVAEIKAAYLDSKAPVVMSDSNLHKKGLKNSVDLHQTEVMVKDVQKLEKDEQKMEKEPSDAVAYQVFDGMPSLENCLKHVGVALSKEIDVVNKDEFDPSYDLLTGDDGSTEKKLEIDSSLKNDEELTQTEAKAEPIVTKELSNVAAHQVFDEMPRRSASHGISFDVPTLSGVGPFVSMVNQPIVLPSKSEHEKVYPKLHKSVLEVYVDSVACLDLHYFDPGGKKFKLGDSLTCNWTEFLTDYASLKSTDLVASSMSIVPVSLGREHDILTAFEDENDYVRMMCFDLGGGCHSSSDFAESIDASHKLKSDEFMLKNEGGETFSIFANVNPVAIDMMRIPFAELIFTKESLLSGAFLDLHHVTGGKSSLWYLVFDPGISFKGKWVIETKIASMLRVALGSWKYPHFVEAQLAGFTKSFWAICLIRKTCIVMPFDPGGQLNCFAEYFPAVFHFPRVFAGFLSPLLIWDLFLWGTNCKNTNLTILIHLLEESSYNAAVNPCTLPVFSAVVAAVKSYIQLAVLVDTKAWQEDQIRCSLSLNIKASHVSPVHVTWVYGLRKTSAVTFIFDLGGDYSRLIMVAQLLKFQMLLRAYCCCTIMVVICPLVLSCKGCCYILVSRAFSLILEDKDPLKEGVLLQDFRGWFLLFTIKPGLTRLGFYYIKTRFDICILPQVSVINYM